ncbi:MAG: hypothetical protein AB7G34_07095 [Hyphomicrobiales bacterium]
MRKRQDDATLKINRLAAASRNRDVMAELRDALTAANLGKRPNWEDAAITEAQHQLQAAFDPSLWSRVEGPLKTAFDKFGLSPEHPHNWRLLLTYFAYAHYGPKPKRAGSPLKRTDDQLCQLLFDVASKRRSHSNASNAEIYRQLIRDRRLRTRYRDDTIHSLKKAFAAARDPSRNQILKSLATSNEITLSLLIRQGQEIADFDRGISELALRLATQTIETKWPELKRARRE